MLVAWSQKVTEMSLNKHTKYSWIFLGQKHAQLLRETKDCGRARIFSGVVLLRK